MSDSHARCQPDIRDEAALADFIYEAQNFTDAKEKAKQLWPLLVTAPATEAARKALVTALILEVDRAVKQAARDSGQYDTTISHILNEHFAIPVAKTEVGTTPADELLALADEYEAGLRGMEAADQNDVDFTRAIREHKLVIAALRAASTRQDDAAVSVEALADWFYDNGHMFVVSDEEEVARSIIDSFDIRKRALTARAKP